MTLRSDLIADAEWNHARIGGFPGPSPDPGPSCIDRIEAWYTTRGLVPAIALRAAPGAPVAEAMTALLVDRAFQPDFRHAWVVRDLRDPAFPPPRTAEPCEDLEMIEDPKGQDLQDWIALFREVFEAAPGTGYGRALEQSGRDRDVHHLLVRRDGRAVAIGTLVRAESGLGPMAGFYNLGVAPAARDRGLGRRVQHWRLRRAVDAGCRWAFLQTEVDWVGRWQQRGGFRPLFDLHGWVRRTPKS